MPSFVLIIFFFNIRVLRSSFVDVIEKVQSTVINSDIYLSYLLCEENGVFLKVAQALNIPVPDVPSRPITDKDVNFLLYTRKNSEIPKTLSTNFQRADLLASSFNLKKKTILHVHGYNEAHYSSSAILPNTILPKFDVNLIIMNWDSYSFFYPQYTRNITIPRLGNIVYNFLTLLITNGVSPQNMYLTGFSAGSQAIGLAAQKIRPKIAKIFAFGPNGNCFNFLPPSRRLSADDADFVEIVHCTTGDFGIPLFQKGMVTFYMNGGIVQPQCLPLVFDQAVNLCSHLSCNQYFFLSTFDLDLFVGVKCDSYDQYLKNQCHCNDTAVVGLNTSTGKSGMYFVDTPPLQKPCGR